MGLAFRPTVLRAQTDSVPPVAFRLDEIVVVVHRTPTLLRESVAATSVFTRSDIEGLHARNLWEILQHVPGLTFVERDGAGQLPMAVARGFFGGGETSYVLLTIDGIPANDTRTGLAEWNQIPVSAIERIEVLRGSASVVYGDAALGAVVHVVTSGGSRPAGVSGTLTGGSWGDAGLSGSLGQAFGSGSVEATVNFERDHGYRERSESSQLMSSVSYETVGAESESLRARLSLSRLENEEPGSLAPDALARDPRSSHPAFQGDSRTRWAAEAAFGSDHAWGDGQLRADVRVRTVDQERVRTLLLTPSFGDTQLHDERDWSVWARAQYATSVAGARLNVGGDGESAGYDSRYCDPEECGEALSEGAGRLWKGALHAELFHPIGERVQLNAGLRLDVVRPEDTEPGAGPPPTFSQWSPRVALNFMYSGGTSSTGHLFATWTRAFKSPSLDQLYDARLIPSGQPGVTFNLSSSDLRPQRSSAFEVGVFQKVPLGDRSRYAEISASAYHQQLDDEIDFDIRTFKYGNILESRHRGAEVGLRLHVSPRLAITQSATLTSVTFRSGEYEGNQLKNIPRRVFVSTVQFEVLSSTRLTLSHRGLGGVYLDDANIQRLDGADLFDAGVLWSVSGVEVSLAVRNLFDTRYNNLGFLLFDPATETDIQMTFPGSGRFVRARVSIGRGDP